MPSSWPWPAGSGGDHAFSSCETTLFTLPIQVNPKYPAPRYTFTLSDPTPTVGAKFGVNVSGVDANTAVTLAITSDSASVTDGAIVIAGTKSFQNTADAAGLVSHDVTIASAGVFTLVGINSAGASVGSQKVTSAPSPPPRSSRPKTPASAASAWRSARACSSSWSPS